MTVRIITGDCRDVLCTLPEGSVDAIVTDPPYEFGFMGKGWDATGVAFDSATWEGCLRVLKPGAHLLAFGGTRTYHRMACAIEDAGFEIRDQIGWTYGSGFPKSRNLTGEWHGWGTALKPAWEPICMARKPFAVTVAANVLKHGTGALNIDGCRVPTSDDLNGGAFSPERTPSRSTWARHGGTIHNSAGRAYTQPAGRWPANVVHDGSEEVVAAFPAEAGAAAPVHRRHGDKFRNSYGSFAGNVDEGGSTFHGDSGSAARFFYCAKADRADRGDGNTHPTVKPGDLMRYLCRLVTPPGGTVLDPFTGSGSTLLAADREGFNAIGIELLPEYADIARRRIHRDAPLFAEVS